MQRTFFPKRFRPLLAGGVFVLFPNHRICFYRLEFQALSEALNVGSAASDLSASQGSASVALALGRAFTSPISSALTNANAPALAAFGHSAPPSAMTPLPIFCRRRVLFESCSGGAPATSRCTRQPSDQTSHGAPCFSSRAISGAYTRNSITTSGLRYKTDVVIAQSRSTDLEFRIAAGRIGDEIFRLHSKRKVAQHHLYSCLFVCLFVVVVGCAMMSGTEQNQSNRNKYNLYLIDIALRCKHKVVGRDVAMHDAVLVNGSNGTSTLMENTHHKR
jgi:hypothetical protein